MLVADAFMREAMAAIEFRRAAEGATRTQDPHTVGIAMDEETRKALEQMVGATGFEPATPRPPV